jgi:hypothetical protein
VNNTQQPTHTVTLQYQTNSHPPCRLAHPQSRSARSARPGQGAQCTPASLLSDSLCSNFTTSSLLHCIALHVHRCATITRDLLLCAHSATQTTVAYSSSSALSSPITYNAARRQSAPLRVCLAESRQSPASSNALVALQKAAECCHYTQ